MAAAGPTPTKRLAKGNLKNPMPLKPDATRSMQKAAISSGVKAENSNAASNEKSVRHPNET